MVTKLDKACKKAVDLLRTVPVSTKIRVVSHYDADGITAAGIICQALYGEGYHFHATLMRNPFTKGFDRLKNEQNEFVIFSDMGSGQLETIKKLNCPVIILDHHQYIAIDVPDHICHVNAHLCGYDGNFEASGATLAYAFAVAVNNENQRLAPLGLVGATGDKQYIGGFSGYNKKILEEAIQKGFLKQSTAIKIGDGPLNEALYYAIDPYYKALSGNRTAIRALLAQLRIDEKKSFQELTDEEKTKLQSYLVFHVVRAGCQPVIVEEIVRNRYWYPSYNYELERFADLLDACGKNGYRSLGLALCFGGSEVFREAEKRQREYKQKVLDELLVLEKKGIQEMSAIQFIHTTSSSLGGVIGGIAMNYISEGKKPLFSLARKNNEIHISGRGNQMLVQQGLDLGNAMKTVAGELGGFGGGHKIASGATIALNQEKQFLDRTNEVISTQIQKG